MEKAVFWFRRDLRIDDNHGFYKALTSGYSIIPVFIFDTEILRRLPDRSDRRVQFIHDHVSQIQAQIRARGSELVVRFGSPLEVLKQLTKEHQIRGVFLNRDHDPYPLRRDGEVKDLMATQGCFYGEFQDHFIFERDQILTDKGSPYSVFTPYSKKWLAQLNSDNSALAYYPSEKHLQKLDRSIQQRAIPSLSELSFKTSKVNSAIPLLDLKTLKAYEQHRSDLWNESATTQLGIHLRFGTVSVRELVKKAKATSQTWTLQLAWRDFFSHVLYHYPRVVKQSFRSEFDAIAWNKSEEDFERWKEGMTGYPLIDAGMRQLKETGWMPNRVRMNVASFLCKDLLIHWSKGERYFASILLDYDLSANNGNWQWAAGTGCDAASYFRVFNPEVQRLKFDPKGIYVSRWIPEWKSLGYPEPMVDHQQASRKAIAEYSKVKKLNK